MNNYNINNKIYKTLINICKYILCLLIIEIGIISVNVIMYQRKNNEVIEFVDISDLNSNNVTSEESVNNLKIEMANTDEFSYYIKVNCSKQIVTVYVSDENGNYNIPVKSMICSTGISTPNKGIYQISDKYEWAYLVGGVYGQYATRITGPILFHSVPYTKQSKSSLEYWEYDKLGQPVSKGCVRLTVEDAKWIFDNCKQGTKVEFCQEENSEKSVKQEKLLKISEFDDELRNWDPTDPDMNNPWLKYKEQEKGEID